MLSPFSHDAKQVVDAKYKVREPRPGVTTKRIMHPLKRVGERGSGKWKQLTGEEFSTSADMHLDTPEYRKCRKTGFATPSGKVELASSGLESLGFDPLPHFREDPPVNPEYPRQLFTVVREDGFFQTGHRHIAEMS